MPFKQNGRKDSRSGMINIDVKVNQKNEGVGTSDIMMRKSLDQNTTLPHIQRGGLKVETKTLGTPLQVNFDPVSVNRPKQLNIKTRHFNNKTSIY